MTTLRCRGLTVEVPGRRILTAVDLEVDGGRSVAIVGPSGSGKSTLLNVVAGILPATTGIIEINGQALGTMGGAERSRFRLGHIGVVFQFGEILPEFTVLENVALPLRFRGLGAAVAGERAFDALVAVSMEGSADALPDSLSGGERQRVAVARALAGEPAVVIADEPTGSLDRANADAVAGLLISTTRARGAALLVATHDPAVARTCDAVFELGDGSLRPIQMAPC